MMTPYRVIVALNRQLRAAGMWPVLAWVYRTDLGYCLCDRRTGRVIA